MLVRVALLAAMPALVSASCECMLPSGEKVQLNAFKCRDKGGTCEGAGGSPAHLRNNRAKSAALLGIQRRMRQPAKCPPVAEKHEYTLLLEGIKDSCEGKDKSFVEGAMCEHDQCVVKAVSQLLLDRVNIMDCKFGGRLNEDTGVFEGSVASMCRRSPNGKETAWSNCPTRWAAYSNEGSCAEKGLDHYDGRLTAYGGFVGQKPEDIMSKYPATEEGRASAKAMKHKIINSAALYQFNDIMEKGCAVCATVAHAGFYAYKKAGILGRLDIVEEPYGGADGHIFLLYSTRDERPKDPNHPCPQGWATSRCHAQFIDNWYAGLKPMEEGKGDITFDQYVENMLHPDPSGDPSTTAAAVPYPQREVQPGPDDDPDPVVRYHSQNEWEFHKPRSNDDDDVATWPREKLPDPVGLPTGWSFAWSSPWQAFFYYAEGKDPTWDMPQ